VCTHKPGMSAFEGKADTRPQPRNVCNWPVADARMCPSAAWPAWVTRRTARERRARLRPRSPNNVRKRFREPRACQLRMHLRERWRRDFSENCRGASAPARQGHYKPT